MSYKQNDVLSLPDQQNPQREILHEPVVGMLPPDPAPDYGPTQHQQFPDPDGEEDDPVAPGDGAIET